jgi:hypothetical protein
MNAANVSRIISLIPERVPRVQSGTRFSAANPGACRYPERLAHLARFLRWLSALDPISKEDQTVLGLFNAAGRPAHAGDEDEEAAGEPEEAERPGGGVSAGA